MRGRGGYFHRFHLLTGLLSVLLLLLISSLNTVAAAWGLSYLLIGGLNGAGAVAYVASTLCFGRLGDRAGFKRVIFASLVAFGFFLVSGFFWHRWWHLVAFAVGTNLFFGAFYPNVEGLLSSRERAQGVDPAATLVRFTLAWSFGNIFGMAFGPWLIQRYPASVFLIGMAAAFGSAAVVRSHLRRHGDALPGPYPAALIRPAAAVDLPRLPLYRGAYRLTFLLGGIVYTAVLALLPKLMALHGLPLERVGFTVAGANVGVFLTFIGLGRFRGWVGEPRVALVLLGSFPLTAASFFLPPSPLAFLATAVLAGVNYAVAYTFALFYGLNSPDGDHGEQGGFHEALVGLMFGLGPLLGGACLEAWPDLRSLGVLALALLGAALAVQLRFLGRAGAPAPPGAA
ncbi:MAG: MFS transporter, partial [Deferrisomatales bacterium]